MQFKICSKYLVVIFLTIIFFEEKVYSLENKILLKIENKIITSLDIENEKKYLEALNPDIKKLEQERINLIAKNSLIREKIKEKEILKFVDNIKLDENFLEKLIRDRYSRLKLKDKNQFLSYLEKKDVNIKVIEEKISIEAVWNQLIYQKYNSKIKINKSDLKKQIEEIARKGEKSYLLYEIIFNALNKKELKEKFNKIQNEISKNGFENAALIYSSSESAQIGGKLGWIKESSLNKMIIKNLYNLKKKDITKPFFTPNGYIILKIEDIKFVNIQVDKEKELKNLIEIKTNQQLNQYSSIYFNKVKKNTNIYEF